MKTYDYYLDEVAKEEGYLSFSPAFMTNDEPLMLAREAAKRYAQQVAKDALNRAAKGAEAFLDFNDMLQIAVVDRDSIKNTEIILP